MGKNVKLQVMICTLGAEGLERVASMGLPEVESVGYLVSCQSNTLPLPQQLQRSDVKVVFTPTVGLSVNRNHALDCATAPYVLIADDDEQFYPAGLRAVVKAFDDNPGLEIAAFMYDSDAEEKTYPAQAQEIWKKCKGYYFSSIEIAMRLEVVRTHGLRFSKLLGLGAPFCKSGEESMFMLHAKRRGLYGMFYPVKIARHEGASTGTRLQSDPGVLRGEGAYIYMAYGLTAIPRLMLKAKRTQGSFRSNLQYLAEGYAYASEHKQELLNVGRDKRK